jgi:hypothetical protein
VAAQRIVEGEIAAVVQGQHRRRRGHDLGQRGEVEQRVGGQRRAMVGAELGGPDDQSPDHVAMDAQGQGGTGHGALPHRRLQHRRQRPVGEVGHRLLGIDRCGAVSEAALV